MPANTGETVLSGILAKYLKKIKSCGGNKDLLSNSKKKKSQNLPSSKGKVEKNEAEVEDAKEAEAKMLRNVGNEHYKNLEYAKAHFYYTKSIQASDKPLSKAMGFANRSAALFHINMYKDCINDVKRALNFGYPENLQYKLHVREACCWKYLKEGTNSCVSFDKAMESVTKYNKDAIVKLSKVVKKEYLRREPNMIHSILSPYNWELPELSFGASEEVPCFSKAVTLAFDKENGRHLIANRDIEIGDVLVVEKAVEHSVAPENTMLFCSHCFKPCFSPVPCQNCVYAIYCDEKCLNEDWDNGHEDSCDLVSSCYQVCAYQPSAKDDFTPENISLMDTVCGLVYRLVCRLGPENIIKHLHSAAPDWQKPENYLSASPEDAVAQTLNALLILPDKMSQTNVRYLNVLCAAAIQTASSFNLSCEKTDLLAAVVLKLILATVCSYKEVKYIFAGLLTAGPRLSLSRIGVGLYLASSYINHSCEPNMTSVFYGSTIVFRAIRPIKVGEQLTVSYHVQLMFHRVADRQEYCLNQSKFTCKCVACKEGVSYDDLNGQEMDSELFSLLSGINLKRTEWGPFVMQIKTLRICHPSDNKKRILMLKALDEQGKQRCQLFHNLVACVAQNMDMVGNVSYNTLAEMFYVNGFGYFELDEETILNNEGVSSLLLTPLEELEGAESLADGTLPLLAIEEIDISEEGGKDETREDSVEEKIDAQQKE